MKKKYIKNINLMEETYEILFLQTKRRNYVGKLKIMHYNREKYR